MRNTLDETILSILISSLIAALTVGGKRLAVLRNGKQSTNCIIGRLHIVSFYIKTLKGKQKNKKKE